MPKVPWPARKPLGETWAGTFVEKGRLWQVIVTTPASALRQTEVHLYGSSRIGMATERSVEDMDNIGLDGGFEGGVLSSFTRNEKLFELSNHLGNVLVTIADKKKAVDSDADGNIDYYEAQVVSAVDYYPFGMQMPGRKYGDEGRFGFNGKERDKDLHSLTAYDYGFRIYNPAIGKFLSVDPITKDYPELTPYQYASNRPIDGVDLDGLEFLPNGEAMFSVCAGEVLIKANNVPSIYKDNVGRPYFNALGVGLTANGMSEQTSSPIFRAPGYNALSTTPSWTFGPDEGIGGVPDDLWRYGSGTDVYTWSRGAGSLPYNVEGAGKGSILARFFKYGNTYQRKAGALGEALKFVQMYKDQRKWKARSQLDGQINTFNNVVKTVDAHIENGISKYDAYKKGLVTREELVNFVLDGSLPSVEISTMFDLNTEIKQLQIMHYGIQIIHNNKGSYNGGLYPTWPWSAYNHKTKISDEILERFSSLIESIQSKLPKADLSGYREVLEKVKKE